MVRYSVETNQFLNCLFEREKGSLKVGNFAKSSVRDEMCAFKIYFKIPFWGGNKAILKRN